ncbi:RAMP superfamily CRISPR-associated protein [Lyngbya aestuarii]|uniref:RAMP superfamily CRISPR-associated protein n=1 Tax=Lyngbya aestuarii TaxID=118322 RepID=UPI000409D31E|nr:RAMP superfamily CRISPR-associated protein [Lyngbya aestuarii]
MYSIKIKLLSDTTFGRGDGVAGLIDAEIEHDRYGFPYLRGRTLKGLLSEECDNLILLLPESQQQKWIEVRYQLFGQAGSTQEKMAQMHVGDACLPLGLRNAIAQQQENGFPTPFDILNSLTGIRQQTAINSETGAPNPHSLRNARAIIRDRPNAQPSYKSPLYFDIDPTGEMLGLLGAGVLALRRIGSDRNRGRGHVQCSLYCQEKNISAEYLNCLGEN